MRPSGARDEGQDHGTGSHGEMAIVGGRDLSSEDIDTLTGQDQGQDHPAASAQAVGTEEGTTRSMSGETAIGIVIIDQREMRTGVKEGDPGTRVMTETAEGATERTTIEPAMCSHADCFCPFCCVQAIDLAKPRYP